MKIFQRLDIVIGQGYHRLLLICFQRDVDAYVMKACPVLISAVYRSDDRRRLANCRVDVAPLDANQIAAGTQWLLLPAANLRAFYGPARKRGINRILFALFAQANSVVYHKSNPQILHGGLIVRKGLNR